MQSPPRTRVERPRSRCWRCQARPAPLGDAEPWAAGTGERRGPTGPQRPVRAQLGATGPLRGASGTGAMLPEAPPVPEAAPPGAGPGPERAPGAAAELGGARSFPRRSCGAALVVGFLPFGQTPGQRRGQRGTAERGRHRRCPGGAGGNGTEPSGVAAAARARTGRNFGARFGGSGGGSAHAGLGAWGGRWAAEPGPCGGTNREFGTVSPRSAGPRSTGAAGTVTRIINSRNDENQLAAAR